MSISRRAIYELRVLLELDGLGKVSITASQRAAYAALIADFDNSVELTAAIKAIGTAKTLTGERNQLRLAGSLATNRLNILSHQSDVSAAEIRALNGILDFVKRMEPLYDLTISVFGDANADEMRKLGMGLAPPAPDGDPEVITVMVDGPEDIAKFLGLLTGSTDRPPTSSGLDQQAVQNIFDDLFGKRPQSPFSELGSFELRHRDITATRRAAERDYFRRGGEVHLDTTRAEADMLKQTGFNTGMPEDQAKSAGLTD